MTDLIELMARAIDSAEGELDELHYVMAKAAVAALRAAGYAIVPCYPTEAMVEAGEIELESESFFLGGDDAAKAWRAMLAAGEIKP